MSQKSGSKSWTQKRTRVEHGLGVEHLFPRPRQELFRLDMLFLSLPLLFACIVHHFSWHLCLETHTAGAV